MSVMLACLVATLAFGNAFSAPVITIGGASSTNSINPSSHASNGDIVFLNFSSSEALDTNVLEVYLEGIKANIGGPGPNFTYTAVALLSGLDKDHILEYNLTNIVGFISGGNQTLTGSTSALRIDTKAPVFDEIVLNPSSGILGIGDEVDYSLRIVNADSSAGASGNNGLEITIDNYTSDDVSFISVAQSFDFNDNNVGVPNGVFGELQISGITFVDRAGNAITGFSSINTGIIVDTIAPSSLSLSNTQIGGFTPEDAFVGQISVIDIGDQNFTYDIEGDGFDINDSGAVLTSEIITEGSYSINVTASDSAGNEITQEFTIVSGDNDIPYNLQLSNTAILENISIGSVVGNLSAQDDDGNISFFSLVDSSNGAFSISGNQLITAKEFDFETQTSYSIIVSATDNENATAFETMLISIMDVDENKAPQDIFLTNAIIPERAGVNHTVGLLIVIDEAGDSVEYSTQSNDFKIEETSLVTKRALGNGTYEVNITATDSANNTFSKVFEIEVTNRNRAPFNIRLKDSEILENASIGSVVGNATASARDGDEITDEQINNAVESRKQQMQARFGEQFDPSMIDPQILRTGVIEQIVDRTLIKQLSENEHLEASSDYIKSQIREISFFHGPDE